MTVGELIGQLNQYSPALPVAIVVEDRLLEVRSAVPSIGADRTTGVAIVAGPRRDPALGGGKPK